jgi:hypothetical protein
MDKTRIVMPESVPFLESLSWFDRAFRDLTPREALSRYESGWRHLGVLADPSVEEWHFIEQLVDRFGSILRVPASESS